MLDHLAMTYLPIIYPADRTITMLVLMGIGGIAWGTSIVFSRNSAPVIVGITLIILSVGGVAYGVSLIPARNRGDI